MLITATVLDLIEHLRVRLRHFHYGYTLRLYLVWRYRNAPAERSDEWCQEIYDRFINRYLIRITREAREFEVQLSQAIAETSDQTGIPQWELRAMIED